MSKVYLQDITLPTEEWGDKTYSFVQTDADLDTAGDAADAKAVGDELTNLKQDFSELEAKTYAYGSVAYDLSDIPNVTARPGSSGSAGSGGVMLSDNESFDSWWFITTEQTSLYPIPHSSAQYYALCKTENVDGQWYQHSSYIDMPGSNGVRYRSIDGNLPTESTPLVVPANTLITITVGVGTTAQLVINNQITNTLNNNVRLNENQIAQTREKTCYIQYKTGTGADSSSEWIEVFLPVKVGYVRYRFVHTEKQDINADIWRVADAYAFSDALVERFALTTPGEWECALKLNGASDFSGGFAHGDEVIRTVPEFFVDGALVDITDYTSVTAINSFSVVEMADMYDPDNQSTNIAVHGSEHIFTADGLEIRQSIMWIGAHQLSNCYLAMLPIAKTVSDKFFTDKVFNPTEIGSTSHTDATATYSKIYGEDNGVSCVFEVPKYDPKSAYFFMTDNGGDLYNKCYFAIDISSGVSNSDFWKSITRYKFDVTL